MEEEISTKHLDEAHTEPAMPSSTVSPAKASFPTSGHAPLEDETDNATQLYDHAKMFSSLIQKLKAHIQAYTKAIDDGGDDPVHLIYSPTLIHKLCDLAKCEKNSAEETFCKFSDCLDCLNIETIECIIKKHVTNDQLKLDVEKYIRSLRHFQETTTVSQLKAKYKPEAVPEGYKPCLQQFNCLCSEPVTIEVIEEIRKASRHAFHSPSLSLVACEMDDTSLILVYLVKESEVDAFSNAIEKYTAGLVDGKYTIKNLLLDDCILYPNGCIEQQFWNACREGNYTEVQTCLESGADPNFEVAGRKVLTCAVRHKKTEVLQLLATFGANLDAQDKMGRTALTIAMQTSQTETARLLLELGASPYVKENIHGMCPLLIAAGMNDVNTFRLCLSEYASVDDLSLDVASHKGQTALILAIERQSMDILEILLSDENIQRSSIDHCDDKGRTALHAAASSGSVLITKRLMEAFDEARDVINLKDQEGRSPSDIALASQNKELIALLCGEGEEEEEGEEDERGREERDTHFHKTGRLERLGASFTKFFKVKESSLVSAAKSGNTTKIQKLLKEGAPVNCLELHPLKWSPLMWASQKGHVEAVKVLLDHGGDPNIAAVNGYTALIVVSRLGYHEIARLLITNHIPADVNIKNKTRGWSALMWTCQCRGGKRLTSEEAKAGRRKIAEDLLAAGADVNSNAYVANGWTPLMQASQDGDPEMVRILTKAEGLEIDHASKSTWTALTTACRKGHTDIIKVLVEAGADVNKKKNGGIAALHITSLKNLLEATRILIDHNADVNIADDWGMTPLMLAVKGAYRLEEDYLELPQYLIKHACADVNLAAAKYALWTAIFFAIDNGDQKMVQLLYDNGAKLDVRDKHGNYPAAYIKGLEMRRFLTKLINSNESSTSKTLNSELLARRRFGTVERALSFKMNWQWLALRLALFIVNYR